MRLYELLVPVAQLALLVLGAPLFSGLVAALRARLAGRPSPPVLRPYREIAKRLLARERLPRRLRGDLPPSLALAATVAATGLVPIATTTAPVGAAGGAVALVGLLALGRFAAALSALASGHPIAERSAGRSAVLGALLEPALLVSLSAVALACGTAELGSISARTARGAGLLLSPGFLLAAVSIAIVVVVETARLPRPGAEALTELTLVSDGLSLGTGGARLAIFDLAGQVRAITLGTLLVNVFMPWGIASGTDPGALAVGLLAIVLKLGAVAAGLAFAGAGLAHVRLLRLPELLGTAYTLGLLALVFVTIHGSPR